MKEDPREELDVGAPSAGFVVTEEVLDHKKDVRYLTCCWLMVLITQAWTVKPIWKMMVVTLDSMMELTVVDLKL